MDEPQQSPPGMPNAPTPPPGMPITPPPTTAPIMQPTAGTPPPTGIPAYPKKPFDMRFLLIGLIILALVGGGIFALTRTPPQEAPAPTATPTPSPTPVQRVKVPLATESAYLDLSQAVASLSASINNLQLNNTTLIPPTIELSLGFPN